MQFPNAELSIVVTLLGIITSFKPLQPSNAEEPTFVPVTTTVSSELGIDKYSIVPLVYLVLAKYNLKVL